MALDSNYKMSKPTKTMLNMMMLDEKRSLFKTALTNAESFYEIQRKKKSIKVVMDAGDEG
jgi:hypothetical protein